MKTNWTDKSIPRESGSIKVNTEPNTNHLMISFYRDGKLIGSALRNGHHLTYNSAKVFYLNLYFFKIPIWKRKGYHSLPYVLYYFAFKNLTDNN